MSENKKKKKKNIGFEISYTDNSEIVNGYCLNSLTDKAALLSVGKDISDISSCVYISDDEINIGEYKYKKHEFNNIDDANKYIEEFKKNNNLLLFPTSILNVETGITTVYTPVLNKGLYLDLASQKKQLHLDDLKSLYKETGSAEVVYAHLKETIFQNKDNPENLKNIISSFLGDLEDLYDNKRNHKRIEGNQVEVLEKILNAEGELKNFVCGTIHGFVMETMRECGIEAGILAGKAIGSANHATLIYKCGENKYIFNDYASNSMIEAANILDAAKIAYKKSGRIESAGFFNISDEKKSYREFILNEAAYSELYDKNSYNKNLSFTNPLKKDSSVNVTLNTSKNGELIAGIESVEANNAQKLSYGIQYKKGEKGELLDNNKSIGFKINFKKDCQHQGVIVDFDSAVSYTQGFLGQPDEIEKRVDDKTFNNVVNQLKDLNFRENTIENAILNLKSINENKPFDKNHAKYISTLFKAQIGKDKTLYSTSNLNVENTFNASVMLTNTFSVSDRIGSCMDGRIIFEDGIMLQNKNELMNMQAFANAGLVIDGNATYGSWNPKPMFGSKFNLGMSTNYKINNQTQLGVTLQGYEVKTSSAKDLGASASAYVVHKPKSGDIDLIFNTGINLNKRNLSVGGFNEKIHNEKDYSIAFKALIKDKYTMGINYNQNVDKLNKTRNKRNFGVNFGINF